MKKIIGLLVLLLLVSNVSNAQQNSKEFPKLTGPYFGQKPPGMTPEVFAPGIVSTDVGEFNIVISPDGREIYFSRSSDSRPTAIMVIKQENGKWSKPTIASFSGRWSDMDPSMSPDGNRIVFGSSRPSGKTNAEGCDIWIVERMASGNWSEPRNVGDSINTMKNENYPMLIRNGTLYFQSNGHGGMGGLDIFRSEFRDGQFCSPENLGDAINSTYNDFDAYIAPDESMMIFSSSNRLDGFGSGDLYVSFRKKDGTWMNAKNMGERINTSSIEYCPKISPDGKYFFFTSGRSGNGDIYWVDVKVIEELKPEELK
ncbi:MAG: hypothetical protein ABIL68_00970 [bacterium]